MAVIDLVGNSSEEVQPASEFSTEDRSDMFVLHDTASPRNTEAAASLSASLAPPLHSDASDSRSMSATAASVAAQVGKTVVGTVLLAKEHRTPKVAGSSSSSTGNAAPPLEYMAAKTAQKQSEEHVLPPPRALKPGRAARSPNTPERSAAPLNRNPEPSDRATLVFAVDSSQAGYTAGARILPTVRALLDEDSNPAASPKRELEVTQRSSPPIERHGRESAEVQAAVVHRELLSELGSPPPANPEDNTLEGTVEVVYDFLVESGVARFDIQASRQAADRAPTSSLVIVVACCLRDPCSFCGNHLSSLCLAAPTSVCVTI
jgi:hypothetical protein